MIYIFKFPQPGQEDEIFVPSTGSAREEDIAIAMSRFSYLKEELNKSCVVTNQSIIILTFSF